MAWFIEILNFNRRTDSDEILSEKAINIAKNPKYYRYQRGLASIFCKYFGKKTSGRAIEKLNKELAEELHKPIIIKFKKRKAHLNFKTI